MTEYADEIDLENDMEDQAEDQTQMGMDAQEEGLSHGPYPEPEEKKDLLNHIQKQILNGQHPFKTANLVWEELGKPNFSVRFWLNLATSSEEIFAMSLVSNYCIKKALITAETSLSREGYINDLTVTNRRVKERQESGELKKFLENRNKK